MKVWILDVSGRWEPSIEMYLCVSKEVAEEKKTELEERFRQEEILEARFFYIGEVEVLGGKD